MVIQIDSAGLSAIYAANQSVTLARQVQSVVETVASTSTVMPPPTVAWQAFQPVETNTVAWADQYYCFASTTPLGMGAAIQLNARSDAPMQKGSAYVFADGRFTQRPQAGTAYVVANASLAGSYAFGMAQIATVNNVSALAPVCAMPVLCSEAAYLDPSDLISIFLSSCTAGGTATYCQLRTPSRSCSRALRRYTGANISGSLGEWVPSGPALFYYPEGRE